MPVASPPFLSPFRFTPGAPLGSTVPPAPGVPTAPNTPSPADTAQALFSLLTWQAAGQAQADVYLDTVTPPVAQVGVRFVGFSFVPTLLPNTKYYWQVVAWNAGGSTAGPVWSFTTPTATAVLTTLAGTLNTNVRYGSMSIHDVINAQPNTASFVIASATGPTVGTDVQVGLGFLDAASLLFGGTIQTVDESYVDVVTGATIWPVRCIDYTYTLNKRRPLGVYVGVSATAVAQDLVARYAPGFTTVHVQGNLPAVTITFDGSADFMTCLAALATAINGFSDVDYSKDVYLFTTLATTAPPNPLDGDNPPLNTPPLAFSTDLSQVRTRVYGKGHAEVTMFDAPVGTVTLPIASTGFFSATGGKAIASTTAGGAQSEILTYTGVGTGYVANPSGWMAQAASQLTRTWTGVVWAPALGLFVAVSGNSDTSAVMTSPDGFTWTTRTSAVGTWEDIAWSPSLGLLVAVGTVGAVMTSPDGLVWTSRLASDDSAWQSVAWSPSLSLFVAVAATLGVTGTNLVMTSPDGVNWTGRTAASTNQWSRVIWSVDRALFVAVATTNAANNAVMTSADGITWTSRTLANTWFTVAWSAPAGLFLATAGTATATSPDGITWTQQAAALPSANWYGLVWTGAGQFVALSDAATNSIAVSPDGTTWTLYTAPSLTGGGRWAITWNPTAGRMVAVGYTGALAGRLMTNTVASVYGTLTGVNANNGLVKKLAAGSTVAIWVQRDDLAAQAAVAALELDKNGLPSDGIHEFLLVDGRRNEASLAALCDADLAIFSRPIVGVTYATRDTKTKSGKVVAISLALGPFDQEVFDPLVFDAGTPFGLTGNFTIQDVTITFDTKAWAPKYVVRATSVHFTLWDLLRRVVVATGQ